MFNVSPRIFADALACAKDPPAAKVCPETLFSMARWKYWAATAFPASLP
jgi:hypothetical protein